MPVNRVARARRLGAQGARAQKWVEKQVAASGEDLRPLTVEPYPGGRCYLPFVPRGRGEVEIVASQNEPSQTNGVGTLRPPTDFS